MAPAGLKALQVRVKCMKLITVLTIAGAFFSLALASCRTSDREVIVNSNPLLSPAGSTPVVTGQTVSFEKRIRAAKLAPIGESERTGTWLGGPEAVSGKIHSGVAVYYQLQNRPKPAFPEGSLSLQVNLRLENVEAPDAWLQVRTSPGVQLNEDRAASELGEGILWRLSPGQASTLSYLVTLPTGDQYLHLLTGQLGRLSSHSILLNPSQGQVKGAVKNRAAALAGNRALPDRDAQGEPIVRLGNTR